LKIYISQGSVATQLRYGGGVFCLVTTTTLLQIFQRMCLWKNYENRS